MVGREKERNILLEALHSDQSEFVAVYGRSRVGKTFLVEETFGDSFVFRHAGLASCPQKEQLEHFRDSLVEAGLPPMPVPRSWLAAFQHLKKLVAASRRKRKVLFVDELPWMDAHKSRFVPALEGFWNGWAAARRDVVLVVCGSATSWIVDKILRDRGGLHNRVTRSIRLEPFTLRECELFAASRRLVLTRRQIAALYMVFGGVPFYWRHLARGLSPDQDVDRLFFAPGAELRGEYETLFRSLFKREAQHVRIVEALAKKGTGLTRNEIVAAAGLADTGALTKKLEELEQCGFVRRYDLPGRKVRGAIWQLVDNFCLFHVRFVAGRRGQDPAFWSRIAGTGVRRDWEGRAFERLCLLHVPQLRKALGVSGVLTGVYAWRAEARDGLRGAQIDLVLDRADGVANLCEMKFSEDAFSIDRRYAETLRNKRELFRLDTGTRKALHLTFVTCVGLRRNAWANDVQSEATLDDLFADV